MAPFAAAGARFGLHVSSGRRPGAITSSGNVSYHSTGEALDMAGNPAGMMGFFRQMKSKYGGRLAELIYGPGQVGVKDGRPYNFGSALNAQHMDHVHVAFDTGAPGVGDGVGRLQAAVAGVGDGPGRIFNWATGHGFTDEQAAGWVGNISQETGGSFNAAIKQPNGPGRGLAQWGGSRFTALVTFAGKRNKPWTDYQTQLDFMWSELQGTERGAYSAIKASKSVESATSAIATKYERAGVIGDRLGPARAALARFGGGKSGAGGRGSGGGSAKTYKKNQSASGGGIGGYDPAATYATENEAAATLPDPFTGRVPGAAGFAAAKKGLTMAGRPLKGGGPTKGISAGDAAAREAASNASFVSPFAAQLKTLGMQAALARLTPDLADDLAVALQQRSYLGGNLEAAKASGNEDWITEAADAYGAQVDAVQQLTEAMNQSVDVTAELAAQTKELAGEIKRQTDFAQGACRRRTRSR
jgi:hypothetical protein